MTFPDEYEYRYPDFQPSIVCPSCGAPSGGVGCCWPELLDVRDGYYLTPHLCTPDCFTFAERRDDPTIEDHFRAMGSHECEGCEANDR